VQQSQQYFKIMAGVSLIVFLTGGATGGSGIVRPSAPDPLLSGGRPGPCDPRLDQPDAMSGVDVNGNPVAQADLPAAKTPVPDEILVPLDRRGRRGAAPVVALDGQTLNSLINPAPGCAPRR
jgi:hypothetical protein